MTKHEDQTPGARSLWEAKKKVWVWRNISIFRRLSKFIHYLFCFNWDVLWIQSIYNLCSSHQTSTVSMLFPSRNTPETFSQKKILTRFCIFALFVLRTTNSFETYIPLTSSET
jgi:hypothetical protein